MSLYLVLMHKEWPESLRKISEHGDSFLYKSAGFCFLFEDYATAMQFAGGDESALVQLQHKEPEELEELARPTQRPRLEVIRGGKA